MRPSVALLLSICAATVLAGCAGNDADPTPTLPAVRYGGITGLVTDEERVPIENASVAVEGQGVAVTTGPDGRFAAGNLAAGSHRLIVNHPQFETLAQQVAVVADRDVQVDLVLIKLPEFRPYNLTLPAMQGHYDCAHEVPIWTGDCGILYEYATCELNYCQPDPVWDERYQFRLDVPDRWETIVLELVWESSGTNFADGMRMYLENTNMSIEEGHGMRVARIDGSTQPLRIRLERGVTHAGAELYPGTNTAAFVPDEGGIQQIRVFPMGKLWSTTGQYCGAEGCLLGVGVALDLDFTVYATIFVNEAAPQGFSYVASLPG